MKYVHKLDIIFYSILNIVEYIKKVDVNFYVIM